MLTKEPLQGRAFPQADFRCGPARAVLAPRPHLSLQRVDHLFELAQPVVMGIIPCGIEDHRRRKKLRAGQATVAAGWGNLVLCQTPARIKWLAKDMRFVTGQNGLEPQL